MCLAPSDQTFLVIRLEEKREENRQAVAAMEADDSVPMGYYRVLREIREQVPRDAIIVNEGASTMDIGRTCLPNFEPRQRLDAGSFGTMGVGLGLALAAAAVHPEQKVVAVEGDSAFGFSGMEIEVACRYKLPITVVVVNNNGIGGGPSELPSETTTTSSGSSMSCAASDRSTRSRRSRRLYVGMTTLIAALTAPTECGCRPVRAAVSPSAWWPRCGRTASPATRSPVRKSPATG